MYEEQGLKAAREGRSIMKHLTDQNVTANFAVETGSGTVYNIPEGHRVVIVNMHVGCEDVEEFAAAYIVACSEIDGGGEATQKHKEIHDHVGAKKEGSGHINDNIFPPIVISYLDGYRSVSMAVKATDNATVVEFGWMGWYEAYRRLSN